MITIEDEESLLETLIKDAAGSGKEKLVLCAGHFPLLYTEECAIEAIDYWGEFSKYTLELACRVGQHAKERGMRVEFVFLADDHSYEKMNKLSDSKIKRRRNRLYRQRSSREAQLPQEYGEIMKRYGFGTENVLRHDHRKNGRRDCIYFSEKVLRASAREINNACAREYTEFIEDKMYFDKEKSHLLSFIPRRCQEHICNVALDMEIKGLSASHVFMETQAALKRNELYKAGFGVQYRRDRCEERD